MLLKHFIKVINQFDTEAHHDTFLHRTANPSPHVRVEAIPQRLRRTCRKVKHDCDFSVRDRQGHGKLDAATQLQQLGAPLRSDFGGSIGQRDDGICRTQWSAVVQERHGHEVATEREAFHAYQWQNTCQRSVRRSRRKIRRGMPKAFPHHVAPTMQMIMGIPCLLADECVPFGRRSGEPLDVNNAFLHAALAAKYTSRMLPKRWWERRHRMRPSIRARPR